MLHVYAIIDSGRVVGAGPHGHEDDAVTAFPLGAIAAAVSRATAPSIEVSNARVWHHEKVLAALMERHAVLPMRFGTICPENELSHLLENRRDALCAALRKLNGKVEMAVRITHGATTGQTDFPSPPVEPASDPSGTAYLMARLARHKANGLADDPSAVKDIRSHLRRHSLDVVWTGPETSGEPFKASCLIDRRGVGEFVEGLDRLETPGLRLSCTGPWAPYSFVGIEAGLGVRG